MQSLRLPFQSPEQYTHFFKTLLFEELRECIATEMTAKSKGQHSVGAIVRSTSHHEDSTALLVLHVGPHVSKSMTAPVKLNSLAQNDIVLVEVSSYRQPPRPILGVVIDALGAAVSNRSRRRQRGGSSTSTSSSSSSSQRVNAHKRDIRIAVFAKEWERHRGAATSIILTHIVSLRPALPQFLTLEAIPEYWSDVLYITDPKVKRARNQARRRETSRRLQAAALSSSARARRRGGYPLTTLCVTKGYDDLLQRRFNDAQRNAILNIMLPRRISLLQGPPGTGKSHTILGIAGVVLHAGEYVNVTSGSTTSSAGPVPHIVFPQRKLLIVAPSNAAVDEVCMRILRDGVIGADLQRHDPIVYRVGQQQSMDPRVWTAYGARSGIKRPRQSSQVGTPGGVVWGSTPGPSSARLTHAVSPIGCTTPANNEFRQGIG